MGPAVSLPRALAGTVGRTVERAAELDGEETTVLGTGADTEDIGRLWEPFRHISGKFHF